MFLPWNRKTESKEFYQFFKNILGFVPRDTKLYRIVFIHRSISVMQNGHRINNERLEYLGDAVLGSIVADFLYHKYPTRDEGFLTEMRSKIVSRISLGKIAQKIGLTDLIEHQRNNDGIFKSIGGDAFEALIGAMYLDKGYEKTRRIVIDRLLCAYIDVDEVAKTEWNYKSKLIDWGQKKHHKIAFSVVRTFVQGHACRREYECAVYIDGKQQKTAIDFSIKAAEQRAAEKTYKDIKVTEN